MPCTCETPTANKPTIITLNQVAAPERRTWRNEEWLVVPVVMAKQGVIMNGATIPEEEFFAPSWNGVPVTFGHPEDGNGEFLSANSPEALDAWAVGYIFSTEFTGGKLKADAWVNVNRAEALRPGSVEALEAGDLQIDVSTGYFAEHQQGTGVIIHKDIKPDHLAVLFDIPGACSFADGCGVRANQHRGNNMTQKSKIAAAVATLNRAFGSKTDLDANGKSDFDKKLEAEANRRGSPDDVRQMVADLVSIDTSPFMPEDMFGLMDLSRETMSMLVKQFAGTVDNNSDEGGNAPEGNAAPEPGAQSQEQEGNMPEDKTPAEKPAANEQVMTDEDRQALAFARNQYAEHRKGLVVKITGNSDMTDEQLKDMDVPTLETIAHGLKPAANYGVRGGGQPLATNEDEAEAESTKAMQAPNVFARRGEGA